MNALPWPLSLSLPVSPLFFRLISLNVAFQVPGFAGALGMREGDWSCWRVEWVLACGQKGSCVQSM